jgi:hypothetical protein
MKTKLVDAKTLLATIFDAKSRPCLRWLRMQQEARTIPFIRIGRLVRFDPDAVRASLERRTVGKILPK